MDAHLVERYVRLSYCLHSPTRSYQFQLVLKSNNRVAQQLALLACNLCLYTEIFNHI